MWVEIQFSQSRRWQFEKTRLYTFPHWYGTFNPSSYLLGMGYEPDVTNLQQIIRRGWVVLNSLANIPSKNRVVASNLPLAQFLLDESTPSRTIYFSDNGHIIYFLLIFFVNRPPKINVIKVPSRFLFPILKLWLSTLHYQPPNIHCNYVCDNKNNTVCWSAI